MRRKASRQTNHHLQERSLTATQASRRKKRSQSKGKETKLKRPKKIRRVGTMPMLDRSRESLG